MSTVTIPKTKYEELRKKADAYEYVASFVERSLFAPPSMRSIPKVIKELKSTKKYSAAFLASLKKGLARSAYFSGK